MSLESGKSSLECWWELCFNETGRMGVGNIFDLMTDPKLSVFTSVNFTS